MPQVNFVPGIPDLVRTSESVLSGYFSMSFSAPHLFGDRVEDYATEMRELLRSLNSSSPAGPADQLLPSRNEAMGGAWLEHATPCL